MVPHREDPLFIRRRVVALDGFNKKAHERIMFLGSVTFLARFSLDALRTHQSPGHPVTHHFEEAEQNEQADSC
jgi:hypothetical protein